MQILAILLATFILLRAERIPANSQPMPPGIPRARAPFPHKRAAPAHDPIIYAKTHGMSLETDEEGAYRIGGVAQEGYESLYFDPTATAEPTGPETKKRHSRSSEAISQEIEDKIRRDSTKVTLSFEPEGSGDDGQVIMDTVLEIVPDNDAELQFVDGSPFVGNFDHHAAWKREKLKKLEPSAKFSSKKPIIVSRKSEKLVRTGQTLRLPIAGKENTVRIPSDRLLLKKPEKKIPLARKLRRSQFESTAILSTHPETLIIMGANEFRGRSMRALRRGRGNWSRNRLSRFVANQRRTNLWKKMMENKGGRRILRKTRDQ